MRKYFQIFKLSLQEYFVYRLNFVLWRFRSFVSFLALLLFWQAVYGTQNSLFGYSRAQMATYIIGVAFLRGLVLASRSADLAGQVRSGELSKFLTRPLKISNFWLTRDLADKLLNLFFTLLEITFAVFFLRLPFYLPTQLNIYLIFILLLIINLLLYFFISFFLSIFAFWTEDIWATRWLFGIVFLEFLSGAFFPLDIFPVWAQKIIYLTPFPYLVFFPLKIWLGQLDWSAIYKVMGINLFWLGGFYLLAGWLWKKGFKKFGAFGG